MILLLQRQRAGTWRQRLVAAGIGLLLWCALTGKLAIAQEATVNLLLPAPPRLTQLTINDGLTNNTITAILQDRQGFLWFGTRDGLNRYDGYTVVTYRHEPNNPNSLRRNTISALFEDQDGLLWIATADGGVARFDPALEQFTHFRHEPDNPNSLGGNLIFSIFQDQGGLLWFGGPSISGLTRYDPVTNTFIQSHNTAAPAGARVARFPIGAIGQVGTDAQGHLWLLTETMLARAGATSDTFTIYPFPNAEALKADLRSFLDDGQGGFWVGGAIGLLHFDPATGHFAPIADSPKGVNTLLRDAHGRLWLGTNQGLYHFVIATQQFSPFAQPGGVDGAPPITGPVLALYADRAGLIWIGTTNGVYQYDGRQQRFQRYTFAPPAPARAAAQPVTALTGAPNGELWVATGAALHYLQPVQTGHAPTVTTYALPLPAALDQQDDTVNQISRLFQDRRGHLWLGLPAERLLEFDPAHARFTEHLLADANPLPGPPPVISGFYEDAQQNLWIAVAWVGLYRLDAARQQLTRFRTVGRPDFFNDTPDHIASATIMAITGDSAGNLWLGHHDGTLSRFTPETGRFQHYPSQGVLTNAQPRSPMGPPPCRTCPAPPADAPPPPPLAPSRPTLSATALAAANPSSWIETLHWDALRGLLWIGERNGLVRFDPLAEQFTHYTSADGLTNSYIVSIAQDQQGLLWLGTQQGLLRFDPAQQTFHTYDLVDGLQDNVFSGQASWQGGDGRLFFGGVNGLTAFVPADLQGEAAAAPVLLTGLRLFNLPVTVGPASPLPRAIWAVDRLTLQPDQSIMAFEFATLNFAAAQQNRYRYRLDGLETVWNEVDGSRRFATYTSLPPGRYTFRVQGGNRNGVWTGAEAAVALTILPHWWQTSWFRLTLGLLLIGAILGGYRWRLYAIQRRNRELATEVAERTAALRESEARFRGLATAAFEAILIQQEGTIVDANDAAVALFGYPYPELVGRAIATILDNNLAEPIAPSIAPSIVPGIVPSAGPTLLLAHPLVAETDGHRADGSTLPLEVHLRMVPYAGADATVVALRDLTERKAAESQRQRLAALEERERIGRDLHDDLGQVIGYINLQAQTARELLEQARPAQAQATLAQLVDVAQAAHNDVRQYILGIRNHKAARPAVDLFTALDLYLEQIRERHGLQVQVSLPTELPEPLLSAQVETQLLRIIQEAITNIRKHAGVQSAQLLFALRSDEVQVIISDEGCGFALTDQTAAQADLENPVTTQPTLHFGLEIMRERAEGVGGRLEIRTAPGRGTQLIVTMPRLLAHAVSEALHGLRVLIADDHPLYREGLRNMLSTRGLQVVAIAQDGDEAEQLAHKFLPDLILMDIEMPNQNGIAATKAIKAALPAVKIVMLTVAASDELLLTALRSGASGYLLKNLATEQFFALLRAVILGETVLSPKLTTVMVNTLLTEGPATPTTDVPAAHESPPTLGSNRTAETAALIAQLTMRQQEVLLLVVQGLTNKEIARKLHITERTVKYHIGLILEQIGVQNRYELIHLAQHMSTPNAGELL